MNNLESFSLSTNLPISRPFLQRDYFPLPFDLSKVILILNTFEDVRKQSRVYDFFQDVIDFGSRDLAKYGYKFFQPITGKEPILKCSNSTFPLTPNQIAYLIDNCALVVGNDNLYSHVANEAGVKNIALFGPSSSLSHAPKFHPANFSAIRETKTAPSYRSVEHPKTINEIKTETILNQIYLSLGLPIKTNIKSIYTGENYPTNIIQIIPDCLINSENFKNNSVTIRMDYLHNEEILFAMLESRKCNIICNKEISVENLKFFKENILQLTFKIKKDINIDYIKQLIKTGVKTTFVSEENDADISITRMKMLDYSLVDKLNKQDILKEIAQEVRDNTYYKTNNFILSDGKIYTTHEKYLKNQPIKAFSQNIEKFDVSDLSLWENIDFIKIFDI